MNIKFDPFLFETRNCNGVNIHTRTLPWTTDAVHVRILVHAGARHDPEGKEGTAHFLEHMPFDGCAGFVTRKEVERADRSLFMDTLGACTSMDWTRYRGKTTKQKLKDAMNFMCNFTLRPALLLSEVIRERAVIIQEIWKDYVSAPIAAFEKQRLQHLYGNHKVWGRMEAAYGWAETVERIEREDLQSFHERHYHRGNLEFVFTGDISVDEAIDTTGSFVAVLPKGERNETPDIPVQWPAPVVGEDRVSAQALLGLKEEARPNQSEILLTRLVPKSVHRELLAMFEDTLRQLLVETIRGKLGAVYSPKVGHRTFIDHYLCEIRLKVRPEALAETRDIINGLLTELGNGNILHATLIAELHAARLERKLTAEFAGDEIADLAAHDLTFLGRIVPMQEEIEQARVFKYNDLVALVRAEFTPEKLHWAIREP